MRACGLLPSGSCGGTALGSKPRRRGLPLKIHPWPRLPFLPMLPITNDAVILGLLAATLGLVFFTAQSEHPGLKAFYRYVPALLLCYFIPGLYGTFGLIDVRESQLYPVASRYLLPATLVLLTLSVDLKGILRLAPKALIMFLTGTVRSEEHTSALQSPEN